MLKWTAVAFLVISLSVSAADGNSRYQAWQGEGSRLQELITRLNALIEQGERDRAADRRFLRDLRDLSGEFDNPWQTQIVSDDFKDGDYDKRPAWKVISGHFEVRRNQGLVALYSPAVSSPPPAQEEKKKRSAGKDLAFAILSEILKNPEQESAPETADSDLPAAMDEAAGIHLPAAISNSFSLSMSTRIQGDSGEYSIAVYQGRPDQAGYRLVLHHEASPVLELQRYGSRGTSIIERVEVQGPVGAQIDLDWKRYPGGDMRVSLNETEVIQTRDRGFQDAFSGIVFHNEQGETALRRISVDGE